MNGRAALFASCALSLLTLTGCPLTDDYRIDADYGAGGTNQGGKAAGGQNSALKGGAGATTLASGGSGGDSSTCSASTCNGACCSGECVDLRTDAANCGKCGMACSSGRACSTGVCTPGWLSCAAPPTAFVARQRAAYASFSGKLFVFGGVDAAGTELNTGAIDDPALDSWQSTAVDTNTPSARDLATAIWTGSSIMVFGGRNQKGSVVLADAALYDPVTNRWTKATAGSTARAAATVGVYSGMAIFWSGLDASMIPIAGADRYRVSTDSWWTSTASNGPLKLGHTACAGIDAYFYAYGGIDTTLSKTDKAYRYSFVTNTWSTIARGPAARWDAYGATDGTNFFVWGGRDETAAKADGSAYETQWVAMGATGAPSARSAPLRESGWTFALDGKGFALLGGFGTSGTMLHDGGVYSTASDAWVSIPAWPSGEDHHYGAAVAAGSELVVFGGGDGTRVTNTCERYSL
ncbi:MAG: kelch repeat-containing protein [Polyangiaceae bacterium]